MAGRDGGMVGWRDERGQKQDRRHGCFFDRRLPPGACAYARFRGPVTEYATIAGCLKHKRSDAYGSTRLFGSSRDWEVRWVTGWYVRVNVL